MVPEDIAIVCDQIRVNARANGVPIPPHSVLKHLEMVLQSDNAYVVEKDGLLVGAMLWEYGELDNWLTVFYILDKYKLHRDVLIPMYTKVVDNTLLCKKPLRYKALHKGIHNLGPCNNGLMDVGAVKAKLLKLRK